ncbi:MAG TPA: TonB-dependent receptor [Syntrophorhabdaceae bacterium]|nr:TonB-dependent receptor [Syntrophorhabdaceae bacterium]
MSRIFCLLLLIALLFSPVAGSAAEKANASPGGPTASSEESKTHEKGIVLPEVVVTATKTNAPAEYSPFTTYTVDRENIESQPDYIIPNYGQLIQDLPGVFVGQAPNKNPAWVNLRGTGDFSARTVYLIDGMPVGSSISFTNTINRNDIERIDVVMGPSSALYGANASGGVVNIITRQGKKDMGSTLSVGYGSNNTKRPYASTGGAFRQGDNQFHYYLSYAGDYSDGYSNIPIDNTRRIYTKSPSTLTTATVDSADYSSTYLSGKAGWIGRDGASFTIAYNYALLNINGGQPNLIPLDSGKQGLGSVRFQLPVSNIMKITFSGGYQDWDRPAKTDYGISQVGSKLVFDWRKRYSQESKVTRTPLELQDDFYLGKNNILTAGTFYSRERIGSDTNTWTTGAAVSGTDYKTDQEAFYLQDQALFLDKKLSLLMGARYDNWKFHDIYDSASTPNYLKDSSSNYTTYRGGAKYRINDQFAIRSSAGTAFYPGLPTWYFQNTTTGTTWRVANPDLKPEKTWMVDLGLEGQLKKTGTSFNMTTYYGKIENMFSGVYSPSPTVPGVSLLKIQNIGKVEIYGLETQINQIITDQFSAVMNLTLNKSLIIEDPANQGNQVANTPSFMGNAGIQYMNPRLMSGSLIYRYVGNQFYDNENTRLPFYSMDSYQTVDLKIWRDWKLTERTILKTALTVENLLDRQFAQEYVYPNPGRTIMGVVSVNF